MKKIAMAVFMKTSLLGLLIMLVSAPVFGADEKLSAIDTNRANAEKEILSLSKEKWGWMSERKVDSLAALFHDEAMFVHMGGSMSKKQELEVIRSGSILYKNVEIKDASVRFVGTTAIVYNRIRLVAVVGGNEVTNPFMVTEVYVKEGDNWKLGALSFTKLLGQ